jgi:hypothetical protein
MSQRNSDTVSSIESWDDDPSDVTMTTMMGGDNGKKNLFSFMGCFDWSDDDDGRW